MTDLKYILLACTLLAPAALPAAEPQTLAPPDTDTSALARFGEAVQARGDLLAVGAPQATFNDNINQGAAYVFLPANGEWQETAILRAANGAANDRFGSSVAVTGEFVAVGAPGASVEGNAEAGAVHVFARDSAGWSETARIVASDPGMAAGFGQRIDLDRNRLLIGAPEADGATGLALGAAYLFEYDPGAGQWREVVKLSAGDSNERFASAVAISGDVIAVSHGRARVNVYASVDGQWRQTDTIEMELQGDELALALDEDVLVIGSPGGFSGNRTGLVQVHERRNGQWVRTASLEGNAAVAAASLGSSIDINAGIIAAAFSHGSGHGIQLLRRNESGEWAAVADAGFQGNSGVSAVTVSADVVGVGIAGQGSGIVLAYDSMELMAEQETTGAAGTGGFAVVAVDGEETSADDADLDNDPGTIGTDDSFNVDAGGFDVGTGGFDVGTGGFDVGTSGFDAETGGFDEPPAGTDPAGTDGTEEETSTTSAAIPLPDRRAGDEDSGGGAMLASLLALLLVRFRFRSKAGADR